MNETGPENSEPEKLPASEETNLPPAQSTAVAQPSAASPAGWLSHKFQFLIGFAGWFLFSSVLWIPINMALSRAGHDLSDEFLTGFILCLPLLLTVGALIGLGLNKRTRGIALGILSAIGINAVFSLFLGLIFNATCLVPFFIKE